MSGISEPLILASQSPRRRELLAEAGYSFIVIPPSQSAEPEEPGREKPEELVVRLARQKAADVAARVEQGIVIGCDTVVECCGQILGKPKNRGHARQILHLLRGRDHRVYSGLCIIRCPQQDERSGVEVTHLFMHPIPDGQIERYLDTGLWEGKAGAFGLQDRLGWIEIRQGSESNVVGLPLELLERLLAGWYAR
ncbi:MAG: Maf-like protein [Pirellulaceae bacterium]|nr:MAG: Maf-like protein [Pirellulaceae bacterium]